MVDPTRAAPRKPLSYAPTKRASSRKADDCSPPSRRLRWNQRKVRSSPGSMPMSPSSSTPSRCRGMDYASDRSPAAPPSTSARAWPSIGSRSKARSIPSGRPSATRASLANSQSNHLSPRATSFLHAAKRSVASADTCRACTSTSRRRSARPSSRRSAPNSPLKTPVNSSLTSCRTRSDAT